MLLAEIQYAHSLHGRKGIKLFEFHSKKYVSVIKRHIYKNKHVSNINLRITTMLSIIYKSCNREDPLCVWEVVVLKGKIALHSVAGVRVRIGIECTQDILVFYCHHI